MKDFSTRSHSCEVPLIYVCVHKGGVTAARVNFSRVLEVSGQERAVSASVGVWGSVFVRGNKTFRVETFLPYFGEDVFTSSLVGWFYG